MTFPLIGLLIFSTVAVLLRPQFVVEYTIIAVFAVVLWVFTIIASHLTIKGSTDNG